MLRGKYDAEKAKLLDSIAKFNKAKPTTRLKSKYFRKGNDTILKS